MISKLPPCSELPPTIKAWCSSATDVRTGSGFRSIDRLKVNIPAELLDIHRNDRQVRQLQRFQKLHLISIGCGERYFVNDIDALKVVNFTTSTTRQVSLFPSLNDHNGSRTTFAAVQWVCFLCPTGGTSAPSKATLHYLS